MTGKTNMNAKGSTRMRKQTKNRARRFSVLFSAVGVVALVATGLALAAPMRPVSHVYTVKASLTPTQLSPASAARGHFDGVLVWSRGGPVVGPLPAGCTNTVRPRSGLPNRISCDHGQLIVTPSKTAGWTLYWIVSFSHLSGPAMSGDVHTSLAPSALQVTLFGTLGSKLSPARGHVSVTDAKAKALLLGKDYAGVNTTASKSASEIRGTITSSASSAH
jgi:hypothetical protein